jgi:hypothetical protein
VSSKNDRPTLRVVRETDAPPRAVKTGVVTEEQAAPVLESAVLNAAVEVMDASIPKNAAFLTAAGCRIADTALGFYAQAAEHAPAGTFRKDVPPGLKSAQATRAWLSSHVMHLKQKVTGVYPRAADLKEAVKLAGRELARSLHAARIAGLKLDARHDEVVNDAVTVLGSSPAVAIATPPIAKRSKLFEMYLEGTDILCISNGR